MSTAFRVVYSFKFWSGLGGPGPLARNLSLGGLGLPAPLCAPLTVISMHAYSMVISVSHRPYSTRRQHHTSSGQHGLSLQSFCVQSTTKSTMIKNIQGSKRNGVIQMNYLRYSQN